MIRMQMVVSDGLIVVLLGSAECQWIMPQRRSYKLLMQSNPTYQQCVENKTEEPWQRYFPDMDILNMIFGRKVAKSG